MMFLGLSCDILHSDQNDSARAILWPLPCGPVDSARAVLWPLPCDLDDSATDMVFHKHVSFFNCLFFPHVPESIELWTVSICHISLYLVNDLTLKDYEAVNKLNCSMSKERLKQWKRVKNAVHEWTRNVLFLFFFHFTIIKLQKQIYVCVHACVCRLTDRYYFSCWNWTNRYNVTVNVDF